MNETPASFVTDDFTADASRAEACIPLAKAVAGSARRVAFERAAPLLPWRRMPARFVPLSLARPCRWLRRLARALAGIAESVNPGVDGLFLAPP